MGLTRGCLAGAVLALCGFALLLRADEEATCTNGRRVRGTLAVEEGGTLRFVPAGQDKPLPTDTVEGVRFDNVGAVVPRSGNSVRALLADGQCVTGELLKLDGERVALRPAWSERIELKRASVAALTHLPGYRTLFADDPGSGGKAWKVTGETLSYEAPTPLDAGRVGVTFEEKDKTDRSWFEVVFQHEAGPRTLRVAVAGPGDTYQVDAAGLKGETREVRRSSGPHRLIVQWTTQSWRVTCDDEVLGFNLEQGPGGALKEVRLHGGVAWSAFYLAKAVDEMRHPPGDAEQDEIWLASDDQWFGAIASADSKAIAFEGRFGKRSVPWGEVCGIYFRRTKAAEPKSAPNRVRVRLRTGFGDETDILEGVMLKLDGKTFALKHAELGELRLDRKWLREMRPVVDRK